MFLVNSLRRPYCSWGLKDTEDLGRVFWEEGTAGGESSGGRKGLDGSVKCLQVPASLTQHVSYCYYVIDNSWLSWRLLDSCKHTLWNEWKCRILPTMCLCGSVNSLYAHFHWRGGKMWEGLSFQISWSCPHHLLVQPVTFVLQNLRGWSGKQRKMQLCRPRRPMCQRPHQQLWTESSGEGEEAEAETAKASKGPVCWAALLGRWCGLGRGIICVCGA